ncbi:hypothetical protein K1T71_006957 [Dendrolimus kikuchii]|uniref:Uncharacterized protein n=1 Tax=Dendrolimus kikuchii TaxID=765133 RepID=A0ACC1CZ52_9NEOP|nr:hypothetical protein K1T71_006957 [Dendrolimus kikuchii]
MSPEPYICDLDEDTNTTLNIYLFKNVENVEDIRNYIIKGEWNCAVIKPSLIIDPFQIAVAANKAVVSEKHNSMVTKTVYAEILYNLSLTKNISQSLSKFGIEKENNLLVCFLITPDKDYSQDILPKIQGQLCSMSELTSLTNMNDVKSVYKLNSSKGDDLLDVIVSRIVTKGFVSH